MIESHQVVLEPLKASDGSSSNLLVRSISSSFQSLSSNALGPTFHSMKVRKCCVPLNLVVALQRSKISLRILMVSSGPLTACPVVLESV